MTSTLPFPGPGRNPPLDELSTLRDGPHAFLLRISQQYGPILRYPLGPPIGRDLAFYLVCAPDGVKHVLLDNHKNYDKQTFQYKLLSSITGQGLLTSDGDFWLRQRRLAQPAFHRSRIAAFAPMIVQAADEMLERWDAHAASGEPLDIAAEMMHIALQIVGRAMFSAEIGDQAGELATATLTVLDHIVHRARTFGIVPEWLPTGGNRRHRRALKVLDGAVYGTIRGRREANVGAGSPRPVSHDKRGWGNPAPTSWREQGQGDPAPTTPISNDLLAMLMTATDEQTGEAMSDRHLRDESMTMLIAGHETVASALAWTWQLLAENPEAEARLHEELAQVLGGRLPAVEDLPRLRYTEMIFQEAMRLYPPAWIITRRALSEDTVCGYRIPAGALVVCSPYVTHRLPELWEEPEAFRPERFASQATTGRHRFAYYPFGGGPRQCIGNHFAQVEASLVVATVAQCYRPRPIAGHPVEVEPGVTLRPKHGLLMGVEER